MNPESIDAIILGKTSFYWFPKVKLYIFDPAIWKYVRLHVENVLIEDEVNTLVTHPIEILASIMSFLLMILIGFFSCNFHKKLMETDTYLCLFILYSYSSCL